jgi:serine/threonine-protein kinase
MALATDPRIGSVLAGYRIEGLLGRGGMGVVYLAHDLSLERKVALKLLAPELSADAAFRERFLRESRLAASIDHPGVIPIHEAGEADGTLFIAMRYVEGTDLKRLLAEEGALEPARAIGLLAQVAEALDVAAHEHGLVHRDVKPANVLIATQAGREHVYLADFGLSRQLAAPGAIERSHFSGSADYVAPEQVRREPLDGRADLYALACVLHECLTGQPPFRRDALTATLFAHLEDDPPPASHANPELPAAIDPVLARGLAKEPAERQATCRDLIDEAREALGIAAPHPGWRHLPRRTKLAAALVVLAVAAAAAIPALLLTGGGTKGPPRADTRPTLAITADSVQRIDPATNELATTSRIGSGSKDLPWEISQVAVGAGAVWATLAPSGTLVRISPATGLISGKTKVDRAAANVVTGLDTVWVVSNAFDSASITAIDPVTLDATDADVDLEAGGPMATGESVWIVETCAQGNPACFPKGTFRAIGGACDSSIYYCVTEVAFPQLSQLQVGGAATADGVLWLSGYKDAASGSGQLTGIDEASHRHLDTMTLDFLPAGGLAAADGGRLDRGPTRRSSHQDRRRHARGRGADPGRAQPDRRGDRIRLRLGHQLRRRHGLTRRSSHERGRRDDRGRASPGSHRRRRGRRLGGGACVAPSQPRQEDGQSSPKPLRLRYSSMRSARSGGEFPPSISGKVGLGRVRAAVYSSSAARITSDRERPSRSASQSTRALSSSGR